jgi:acyl carrier protein
MPISDELRKHVHSVYIPDTDPTEIADDLDLLETGVIDSLGVLRLTSWMDQRYEIALGEADVSLDDFRSISSMAALIRREQTSRRKT